MAFINRVQAPGIGISFGLKEASCTNSSGVALLKGALVMLDLNQVSAAVTAVPAANRLAYGPVGSVFRHFIIPQDNAEAGADLTINGLFGVLQENTAAGADGNVVFSGRTVLAVTATTATTAQPAGLRVYPEAGVSVTSTTAAAFDPAIIGGQKVIGILLSAVAASAGIVSEVLFDGIYGFK